jgi:uncharacterized membrane protein
MELNAPVGVQLAVRLTRVLVMFAVIVIGHVAGLDLGSTPVLLLLVLAAVVLGHLAGTALARLRGWR